MLEAVGGLLLLLLAFAGFLLQQAVMGLLQAVAGTLYPTQDRRVLIRQRLAALLLAVALALAAVGGLLFAFTHWFLTAAAVSLGAAGTLILAGMCGRAAEVAARLEPRRSNSLDPP